MNKLEEFHQELEDVLKQYHRKSDSVRLIVASKYFTIEQILKLYQLGQRDFGENKVQDALDKIKHLPKDICWHFIGHLQKNKVNKIIDQFEYIHSIDSFELAEKISLKSTQNQKLFAQINVSNEESKSGFSKEAFLKIYPQIQALKHVNLCGLMTMAPLTEDQKVIETTFFQLKELKDHIDPSWHLSMGMSTDYKLAIKNGADMIRIGRRLITNL